VSESQHDGEYVDQGAPAQDEPEAESWEGPDPEGPGVGDVEVSREDVSEDAPEAATPDLSAAAPSRVEHTGNPVVDSVLDSLEELDRLPPSEHVAVFEAAHERLRGALSDAGEPPADG
jgi:hypothetical protein